MVYIPSINNNEQTAFNFEFWLVVIRRRGFYLMHQDTIDDIRKDIIDNIRFQDFLFNNGLTITKKNNGFFIISQK